MCKHNGEPEACWVCEENSKAKREVYRTLRKKQIYQELRDGKAMEALQEIYDAVEKAEENKCMSGLYWITVNPKEQEFVIQNLQDKIEKLKAKAYINEIHYVFEQRGESEDEMGKGTHVHLLCDVVGTRTDNFKRSVRCIFEPLCGLAYHVNIKKIREAWKDDKIKYMSGEKWDEGKDIKCEVDVVWRQRNGIEPMYHYKK